MPRKPSQVVPEPEALPVPEVVEERDEAEEASEPAEDEEDLLLEPMFPRRGRPPRAAPEILHVSPRPRGVRGPRSLTSEQMEMNGGVLNKAREFQDNAYQEVDTLLASLNFASRRYEVRVSRLEPDTDENGVTCTGLLQTYRQHVTVDQIQQKFGGGVYEIKIFGPHPTTGRPGIIKSETFPIAGLPKPMPSHRADNDKSRSDTSEVLRAITESNERNQQRVVELLERNRDAPSVVQELLPVLAPLLEKLLSKNDQSTQAIVELQREERRAEERRRDDEKKADEEHRREEREERRRDEDLRRLEDQKIDDRRREDERRAESDRREHIREERERAREERAAELMRLKEEREADRARALAEAAEKQRQHERDLAAQNDRAKQDHQRTQEYMSVMHDLFASKSESSGVKQIVEQLLMLKNLQGTLTASDEEQTSFDKFTEGFQNVVSTVMPVVQQIAAARKPVAVAPQPATQQPFYAPKPLLVDLGPQRPALTMSNVAQEQAQAQQGQQGQQAQQGQQVETILSNDLIEFAFPTEADDMNMSGLLLLKNVDLAVQRNMTPQHIVETILEPFEQLAPMVTAMMSGMTTEQLLGFITANVPSAWALMSPKGEELLVATFELWQSGEDEGKAA